MKNAQQLKQGQELSLNPQVLQAIKLLALGRIEMGQIIAAELESNPMLEETGGVEEPTPEREEPRSEGDHFDWQSYMDSFNSSSSAPPSRIRAEEGESLGDCEAIAAGEGDLASHLEGQLWPQEWDHEQFNFAREMIHNLDDNGYLALPLAELAAKFGFSMEEAQSVRRRVMALEPQGCGAADLVECLLAQARLAGQSTPLLERIVRDHLSDLYNDNHRTLATNLGVEVDDIRQVAALLRNWHPRPGRLVAGPDTHYIVPDIFVVQRGRELAVKVNDEDIPSLRVSRLYQDILGRGGEEAAYIRDKLDSAMWLIKSIHRRQDTIHRVATAIVNRQGDFFRKGQAHLKPMIMDDISKDIGMHSSTVSRVCANKYMHTPLGTFSLKYFFSSSVGNEETSHKVLKLRIKELIEGENPRKPFSDQRIVGLLAQDGLVVARRTVAKYRESLGILPSVKRKKTG